MMQLCSDNKEYRKSFLDLFILHCNITKVLFIEFNDDIYHISPVKQVVLL